MFRLFFYLIGFGMLVIGSIHSIAYLNILTIGNGLTTYFLFILTRPECLIFVVGLIFIFASTYSRGQKKE